MDKNSKNITKNKIKEKYITDFNGYINREKIVNS